MANDRREIGLMPNLLQIVQEKMKKLGITKSGLSTIHESLIFLDVPPEEKDLVLQLIKEILEEAKGVET